MYGKELDIEEFNIQQPSIILSLEFFLNNLWPNTSSMFRITPIQEGHDTEQSD